MLQEVTTGRDPLSLLEAAACLSLGHVDHHSPNLKTDVHHSENPSCDNTTSMRADNVNESSAPTKPEKELDINVKTSSSLGMDLNEQDVCSRLDQELFYSHRSSGHVKSRVSSECRSSTWPSEENEPLKMWKAMKQNGFLSCKQGGIPVQKQRFKSRKSKDDIIKKKIEIAKREQVNRFTKIAAPSGLLGSLNPGIINHVRNSKQVHSIIEAMVRFEKQDCQNQKMQVAQLGGGSTESSIHDAGTDKVGLSYEDESCKEFLGRRHTTGAKLMPFNSMSIPSSTECKGGISESHATERSVLYEPSIASQSTPECEDDILTLRLSSATTVTHENVACMSIEEFSPNQETITSLSLKGKCWSNHPYQMTSFLVQSSHVMHNWRTRFFVSHLEEAGVYIFYSLI